MWSRCTNKNAHQFKNYGARGITVCDRWKDFWAFIDDMGERPTASHSIDRIDVNGNYEPSNCRWATSTQQNRNRRNNSLLEFNGETKCLAAWAEERGIKQTTLLRRLERGRTVAEALAVSGEYKRKKPSRRQS
jgi:hypothetical protein